MVKVEAALVEILLQGLFRPQILPRIGADQLGRPQRPADDFRGRRIAPFGKAAG